ncbi:MAG: response regulator transcription factor [Elusimicrobiales bacterium]|nr:response regulator transcription factor [Elusimicrobiales bacterium]
MEDNIKVLIADDEPDITELVKAFLSANNFECDTVTNGRDALSKIREKKYDVVILDVMMPYIDGYHVAYEISNQNNQLNCPVIIILTSRDVQLERPIAKMSGAFEIIQKPFKLDVLLETIMKGIKDKKEVSNE